MDGNKDTKMDDSKTTHTETTVTGATVEKAPTPPDVTTAADNSLNDTVMGMTVMGDATSEMAPTAPDVTAGSEGGVLSRKTVKLVTVTEVTAGNKTTSVEKKFAKEPATVDLNMHVKYNCNPITKDDVENTTAVTKPSKKETNDVVNNTTAGSEITAKTGKKSSAAGCPEITAKTGKKITAAGPEITAKTWKKSSAAGSEITAETGKRVLLLVILTLLPRLGKRALPYTGL